jgi:uncharacterized protein (TIGR04255 family)
MFSNDERFLLRKNQLGDVICQLRFPEILLINAQPPVAFQEIIRNEYPQYSKLNNTPAPKISGVPGHLSIENQPSTPNHQFVSADGKWRVNLTSTYISLSCNRYSCWEEFAKKLDKPLAAFIQIYKPAFFQRIGLRYLNFISRKSLSLEQEPFRNLICDPYLGILAEEDVTEASVTRCTMDVELAIRGGCRVKIHAGPGLIKKNGASNNEIHFIFDQDLFMPGNVPVNLSAGALQTLHSQAYSIFRGAITDLLFDAMEPTQL